MKLQGLLDKHKDKLWDGLGELVIDKKARDNYQTIVIDLRINDEPTADFSLADLLFNTPFLSLLEWEEYEGDCYDRYTKYESKARNQETDYSYQNYHKINLVLLNTDEERKSYLENNTI